MDKSWLHKPRSTKEYRNGLNQFLDMASLGQNSIQAMERLYVRANTVKTQNGQIERQQKSIFLLMDLLKVIRIGLYTEKIDTSSSQTAFENSNQFDMLDDMDCLVHDAFGVEGSDASTREVPNEQATTFYELLGDAQQELYPGCKKFSKLAFIIRLFHLKCMGKWSNKTFTMLLELLKEAFPDVTKSLPKSYYEMQKIIGALGLTCTKIDSCPNDCMLYWKEHENDTFCHICNTSRYKQGENDVVDEEDSSVKPRKIAAKVLRYFPLTPRLQRIFMSSKTASLMRWHKEECTKDGCMRHPSDSPVWHTFDRQHHEFAKDSRNVRLGLASDGFSPFKTLSVTHSTWPVIVTPYNIPPWMCMKEPFFFLTLLIPGPSSPGNNIDVYLQPLVEELKELWNGIETYDASNKKNFNMRASLLWTINDFPAYANLSGWSTKGELACPVCHKDTWSKYLYKSRKQCYMGHRRFLNSNHSYRKDANSFDGKEEHRRRPSPLTGDKILDDLGELNVKFGKKVTDNPTLPYNWKKRSIFFNLPYWKDNMLRHNLDVMHIEKNICDSVLGTLLNLEGKTKDHENSRLDLKDMGIRHALHPTILESGRKYLPAASFSMSKREKDVFFEILQNVKVPDGYASNISKRVQVKPLKLSGLKSHDNHILMQQLLPISLRKVLPKQVRTPLINLCKFFRELCSKVLNPRDLVRLEEEISITLCELEKIFPPSFFDIMVHLTIHLAYEARLGGPVQYRWMYPIERYLSTLKSYVRNRSRPEGSIAEGYLMEECLNFCSRYLEDVDTKYNKVHRNDAVSGENTGEFPIYSYLGRHIGKVNCIVLDKKIRTRAHQYILFNCAEIASFIEEHKVIVKDAHPRLNKKDIERINSETFADWLYNHVEGLHLAGNEVSKELRALARGPNPTGKQYRGFIINGFRFHVKNLENRRKTQNSGVVVTAQTSSFASRSDNNPIIGDVTYYGVLNDIIELEYFEGRKVVVFDCDWVSTGSAVKQDEHGFTLVNFSRARQNSEPFILASQAQQVFYVEDPNEKGWRVAVKTNARDSFDMDPVLSFDLDALHANSGIDAQQIDENEVVWIREDVDGIMV